MLKIDLLPKYINTRKQVRVAIVVVAVLVAAEVAALIAAQGQPRARSVELTTLREERNNGLQALNPLKSQADAIVTGEQGLQPKLDFINNMLAYNRQYPGLYTRTAGYTYREVTLLNLEATSNQLKFDAYVSNPVDVSRVMLYLTQSPDFQGLPQVSGVPGFSAKEERERLLAQIQAQMQEQQAQQQDAVPGSDVIGAIPGGPGQAGYPGANGPGGNGAEGSSGYPGANGPGGNSAEYGGSNGPSSGSEGSSGNGPGGNGGEGGGGGNSGIGVLALEGARQKPRGFTITVTCALTAPITRPSYGTSDAQAGATNSGGGGGGNSPGGFGNSPS